MELGEVGELLVEADFVHVPPAPPSPHNDTVATSHTGGGGGGSTTSFGRGSSLRGLLSLATIASSRVGGPPSSSAHTTPRHSEGPGRPASFASQYGTSVFGGSSEVCGWVHAGMDGWEVAVP